MLRCTDPQDIANDQYILMELRSKVHSAICVAQKFQKDEALANDDMETMSGNSVLETYIDMLDDILHDLISPSERQLSNAEANADNDRHAA
jgi:hypothetical protein